MFVQCRGRNQVGHTRIQKIKMFKNLFRFYNCDLYLVPYSIVGLFPRELDPYGFQCIRLKFQYTIDSSIITIYKLNGMFYFNS